MSVCVSRTKSVGVSRTTEKANGEHFRKKKIKKLKLHYSRIKDTYSVAYTFNIPITTYNIAQTTLHHQLSWNPKGPIKNNATPMFLFNTESNLPIQVIIHSL